MGCINEIPDNLREVYEPVDIIIHLSLILGISFFGSDSVDLLKGNLHSVHCVFKNIYKGVNIKSSQGIRVLFYWIIKGIVRTPKLLQSQTS